MQKLWFFVQPAMQTMGLLREVIRKVDGLLGGEILNTLYSMMESHGVDHRSSETLSFLFSRAIKPYLCILRTWVFEGQLGDRYNEFMIADEKIAKETVHEDIQGHKAYWERRYTLRHNMVTSFLQRYQEKILTTGKYLNVVRECDSTLKCFNMHNGNDYDFHFDSFLLNTGSSVNSYVSWMNSRVSQEAKDFQCSNNPLSEAVFGDLVDRAYMIAGSTLQHLLMHAYQLIERLRSIKHYFLLDQGDLYVNFMDIAEEELGKEITSNAKPSMEARVEALLSLAVQSSVSNLDQFKDDLAVEFAKLSIFQHLENIHGGNVMRASKHHGSGASSAVGRGGAGAHNNFCFWSILPPIFD